MGRDGLGNEALDCRTGQLFRADPHLVKLPVVAAFKSAKMKPQSVSETPDMTINTDEEKRPVISSLIKRKATMGGKNAMNFYQNNRLVTAVSTSGTRHLLRWQDIAMAQLEQTQPARLLQADEAGSVLGMDADSMTYSPYGHLGNKNSQALLAFNGQQLDRNTSGYALGNGYRTFNPNLGRFCGPDTLSPFEIGGLNAYAYCAGDPINNIDPSGHFSLKPFKNLFAGRKRNKISRITKYSEEVNTFNKALKNIGLMNSYKTDGRIDLSVLYENNQRIDRNTLPTRSALSEKINFMPKSMTSKFQPSITSSLHFLKRPKN